MSKFSVKNIRNEFKNKGIFHTNKSLALKIKNYIIKYAEENNKQINNIIDICVGGGGLLSVFDENIKKYGCDIESNFIEYCKEIMPNGDFYVADCLKENPFKEKFDFIVGNYPFSLKGNGKELNALFQNYPYKFSNTLDNAFIYANLNILADDGICVLISSLGVTFRTNISEYNFRKYLVENNLIDTIEWIKADNHFDDTKIDTCLFVFRKNKKNDIIKFIQDDKIKEFSKNDIINNDFSLNPTKYFVEDKEKIVVTKKMIVEQNNNVINSQIKAFESACAFWKAIDSFDKSNYLEKYLEKIKSIIKKFE